MTIKCGKNCYQKAFEDVLNVALCLDMQVQF